MKMPSSSLPLILTLGDCSTTLILALTVLLTPLVIWSINRFLWSLTKITYLFFFLKFMFLNFQCYSDTMALFCLVSYFLHAKLLQWWVIISDEGNSDIFKMYIKNCWTSNLQFWYGSEIFVSNVLYWQDFCKHTQMTYFHITGFFYFFFPSKQKRSTRLWLYNLVLNQTSASTRTA